MTNDRILEYLSTNPVDVIRNLVNALKGGQLMNEEQAKAYNAAVDYMQTHDEAYGKLHDTAEHAGDVLRYVTGSGCGQNQIFVGGKMHGRTIQGQDQQIIIDGRPLRRRYNGQPGVYMERDEPVLSMSTNDTQLRRDPMNPKQEPLHASDMDKIFDNDVAQQIYVQGFNLTAIQEVARRNNRMNERLADDVPDNTDCK